MSDYSDRLHIIDDLIELQGDLTDAEFCRRYLLKSGSMWSQLKNRDEAGIPKYATAVADFNAVLDSLTDDLHRIKDTKSFERDMHGVTFFLFPSFAMALNAVKRAATEPKKRLIAYLAETNGGKTQLINHLVMKEKADRTHARESWRVSYKSALVDILTDLHIMPLSMRRRRFKNGKEAKLNPMRRTECELEHALIAGLNQRRRIIAIDEAHVFGVRSINLLKTILNETSTTVFIAALPVLFDRWMAANWDESRQLLTRAEAIIEAAPVTDADVKQFLTGVHLNGETDHAAAIIAEASNKFGLYGFVKDVTNRLRKNPSVDLKQVSEAINITARFYGRDIGNDPRRLRQPIRAIRAIRAIRGNPRPDLLKIEEEKATK